MLAGRRPFEGDSAAGVALKRLTEDPPPPTDFRPVCRRRSSAIVMRALARDADDRYPDAGAMAEALREFRRDPASAPVPHTPAGAVAAAPVSAAGSPTVYVPPRVQRPADRGPVMPPSPRTPYREERRSGAPWWIWLLGLLGIALLGTIGFLGAQIFGGIGPDTTPTPAPGFTLADYRNQTFTAANLDLTQKGLTVTRVDEASTDIERGRVISTEPAAGASVRRGDTVTVHVSTGPPQTSVPRVEGQNLDLARQTLDRAKLAVGRVTYEFSPTAPAATVIRTDPTEGTPVSENTPVDLVLSQGPEPTPTPTPTPTPSPTPSPTPIPATPTPTPTLPAVP